MTNSAMKDPSEPDYSGEQTENDPNILHQLHQLVLTMMELKIEDERLEEELKTATKQRREYEENLIPALMTENGIDDITIGGFKLKLVNIIRASFPRDPEKREQALSWLKETGNDGIVKQEFKINYGRGDALWAESFVRLLKQERIADHAIVGQNTTIHPSTLKSFLGEQLRLGVEVPMASFGAFEQQFAKISKSKK